MPQPLHRVLAQWRSGDPEAFDALYDLTEPSFRAFCRLLAREEAPSADLFQEGWRQAIARIGHYRQDASFQGWWCTLARNLWIDLQRRRASEERMLSQRRPSVPEAAPEQAWKDRGLHEALARLPDPEREVVTLYHLQGLSLREAAESLGISHVAASKRLAKAHRSLAALLGESGESG